MVMDIQGMEAISEAIDEFANGNPMNFEIDIAEGVWFNFDCGHSEDLMEPTIPIAIGIDSFSPHNEGKPTTPRLMDYSDTMDELTADLDTAFYEGGSRNEEVVFEYSPHSSNMADGYYLFLGSIDNPRVSVSLAGRTVNEEYV